MRYLDLVQAAYDRLAPLETGLPFQGDRRSAPDVPQGGAIRFEVHLGDERRIGGGLLAEATAQGGHVIVEVYLPRGTGIARFLEIADSIDALFRGQRDGDITYSAIYPDPAGVQTVDEHDAQAVLVEFDHYAVKAVETAA
ncbi:MAG: hypothetical protein AAGN46_01250 [Acidobacteriota bacterium]